ncbi:transcriptional regulator [Virgisporangium aliadipatigenens]|uniref:Transcriptional regulator n=1 Tax=Virgisporangium aliadipatigenens TaxID=741659 RepID=A0A8J3YEY6_9ACTN|nr:helix-turn-helix transcriptional regulator [Virgisporangium aliadipatigenens]GIJ43771.1 transcriptional regulator [Virgisporangium aliadipatigenens]
MPVSTAFGEALRGWRERATPRQVGLVAHGRRRAPGLRRSELAQLADTSVDYVVQLEQGRATSPSAQVVAALSRALRLAPDERDHLYRCANLLPPTGDVPREICPDARRLMDRLPERPVVILAADWTVLGWNAMWTAACGDPAAYDWPYDNFLAAAYLATDGRSAEETGPWPVRSPAGPEATETALVADLRATATTYPADARLAEMIDRMLAASPRFARLWTNGTVRPHAGQEKIIEHPAVGEIRLDCEVLMVPGADLKLLTMFALPGSDAAAKLGALRAGAAVQR